MTSIFIFAKHDPAIVPRTTKRDGMHEDQDVNACWDYSESV